MKLTDLLRATAEPESSKYLNRFDPGAGSSRPMSLATTLGGGGGETSSSWVWVSVFVSFLALRFLRKCLVTGVFRQSRECCRKGGFVGCRNIKDGGQPP